MHRTITALLLCVPILARGAAPEGRWEGPVAIPGNEVQVLVDLALDGAGAWTGSIIMQGLGVNLDTGNLLWEYYTEASRRNDGWVLTADRQFNGPLLFWSSWREVPIVATVRQFGAGSIFSSPLVVGGVVYFGSTDGNLYALE